MTVDSPAQPASDQLHTLLTTLFDTLPERPFAIRLNDGETIEPDPNTKPPNFTLVLKRPAALRRMFLPPSELALGEGYIFDDFDIEGDMVAAFRFIENLDWQLPPLRKLISLGLRLLQLERADRARLSRNSKFASFAADGRPDEPDRDKQAARFHYDLSNAFFEMWLDKRMVYSCAYFADTEEDLDSAQKRKLDRICRKLKMRPGEHFLDIGCGWGGLIIHAAAEYGVLATGISLSKAQTEWALARIEALGLSDRCQINICHYEQYITDEPFEKVASVGMFEHVNTEKLVGYFKKAHQLLRPGGLFLLQGGSARIDRRHVGRNWMDRLGRGRNAFMQKYSFPDSRLNDIPTVLLAAEQAGFETRKVESLREHYPLTLRHWLTRLEQNRLAAESVVGQAAYRAWRLVLAGYIYLIEQGNLTEYQTLFAKPTKSGRSGLDLIHSE